MSDQTSASAPEKPPTELSELQKFAHTFTADWRLRASSFHMLANEYLQQLPPDRKEVLAKEFRAFLYESNADSDEALLQLWYEQGAEVWDFDVTVRPTPTSTSVVRSISSTRTLPRKLYLTALLISAKGTSLKLS
jgi:hypothetical protein